MRDLCRPMQLGGGLSAQNSAFLQGGTNDVSIYPPSEQQQMKRTKQLSRFCSPRAALVLLTMATSLLLLGRLAEHHLTLRLSLHTARPNRHVVLLSEYPGFCSTLGPLTVSRSRWFHSTLLQSLPRRAATRAAASAADAVYEAAVTPLGQAEDLWKAQAANASAQLGVLHAALNITHIMQHVPPYPQAANAFKGRGIVIVGGGKIYTPPAFACVAFLRKTGCQLPIEVWAPPHEPIPSEVIPQFESMTAVVRQLGDVLPERMHYRLRKFVNKPAAILASSFREVLLLDSDNIPLRDPSYLFQHELYTSNGLLMWPDFWDCQAKPAAWSALEIPPELRPKGSHESGQLVIDKQRNWRPLLLSLYLNLRGDLFYPMLSDIGQGDKETLPYSYLSLAAASGDTKLAHYGLVPHPVLALGVVESNGQHNGFAMLQRGPEGSALFVHAHMPKVDLKVTGDFEQRRWVNLTGKLDVRPAGVGEQDASSFLLLNAVAGYDVERAVHVLRQQLRCDPMWVNCCL